MKSKYLLPIFALLLLFTACNDDNTPDQELQDAQVSINTVLESASTKSYDRGTAPAYISGINIIATHQDYDFDVDRDYEFVGVGETGVDISMTVKAGTNTFNATSFATYDPFSKTIDEMDRSSLTTLNERVEDYAEALKTDNPIFVTYTASPVTQSIIYNQDNEVNLSMIPDQGRINIVFDTEIQLDFSMTAKFYDSQDVLQETQSVWLDDETKACAIIFNRSDMTEGSYIDVTITKNAMNSLVSNEQVVYEGGIDVVVGENYTHLYNFNGTETTSVGFGITFEPVSDSNGSTEIIQ